MEVVGYYGMGRTKGCIPPNKGLKHSDETKLKISVANKGKPSAFKGKHHTPEAKLKLSLINKGKPPTNKGIPMSKEQKEKMSLSHKGKPSNRKGKYLTKETKLKISLSRIGKYGGENSHFWKGGISTFPYPFDWTDTLKESIRQRDNYICQECGIHQDELIGWNKKLDIHHIDYDKKNLNPLNLISLCRSCHIKTNYYRDKWYEYFITKIL
jgi:hypothetical protein